MEKSTNMTSQKSGHNMSKGWTTILKRTKSMTMTRNALFSSVYWVQRRISFARLNTKEKSYKELTEEIKAHYLPKPSVIVQRYKFNTRSRQSSESISTFLAELRALSEYCEFGRTLDKMLRDRLVRGKNEDRIQRCLLAEPTLDFKTSIANCGGNGNGG